MTYYVYTAWDVERRPLYVGCTGNVDRRMSEHRHQSGWHIRLASLTVMEFPTQELALRVESHQISKLRPAANIQDNPRYRTVGDALDGEEWYWELEALTGTDSEVREWLAAHPDATPKQREKMALVMRLNAHERVA